MLGGGGGGGAIDPSKQALKKKLELSRAVDPHEDGSRLNELTK